MATFTAFEIGSSDPRGVGADGSGRFQPTGRGCGHQHRTPEAAVDCVPGGAVFDAWIIIASNGQQLCVEDLWADKIDGK